MITNYKYYTNETTTAKKGLISLSLVTLLFTIAFIDFYFNYDDYSGTYYSIKRQRNIQGSWGYFVIPTFVSSIFLLIFSIDYKLDGIGIEEDRILVNKDFIKSTEIHFSEIKTISQDQHSINFTLTDYTKLIENQPILFKLFARKKIH